jgi:hypothetical protein
MNSSLEYFNAYVEGNQINGDYTPNVQDCSYYTVDTDVDISSYINGKAIFDIRVDFSAGTDVSDGKCAATDECQGPIPFLPPAEEKIYVKDFSICHNPDNTSFDAIYCSSEGYNEESCLTGTITTYYSWDFFNATSSEGIQDFASSTVTILETGEWGISATTTDTHSPDQSCGHEEGGGTGLPLPEWIEVAPY